MKLLHEWRYVAGRAWSMRLVLATAVLGAMELTLPLFSELVPKNVFAGLSMLTAIAAAVARVLDQPGMDRRKRDEPVETERRTQ